MIAEEQFTVYILDLFSETGDAQIEFDREASHVHKFIQSPGNTVFDLKEEIEKKLGYESGSQRLLFLKSILNPEAALIERNTIQQKKVLAFEQGMSKPGLQALGAALQAKAWAPKSSLRPLLSLASRETWRSLGYTLPWTQSSETWLLLKQVKIYTDVFVADNIQESETAFTSQVTFDEYIDGYTPSTPHVATLETIQNQIQSLSVQKTATEYEIETGSEMYYEESFEAMADEFDAGY